MSEKRQRDALAGVAYSTLRGQPADILLVDEEGLYKGLAWNRAASLLANRHVVGPAVHLTGAALAAWKADK